MLCQLRRARAVMFAPYPNWARTVGKGIAYLSRNELLTVRLDLHRGIVIAGVFQHLRIRYQPAMGLAGDNCKRRLAIPVDEAQAH